MKYKIFGTTLYIDKVDIETIYGTFSAYTFQNLINKGYILALSYGDIKSDILYTRIHSSCVTSETLESMDCDCVQQLNGAFKKITEKKNGILFYLIQEGRGCGYVGKSRACMNVQYTKDKMNTFEAYKLLGMKSDYREYSSIGDICKILDINPEFVLLTNNPDKIQGLLKAGCKLKSIENIKFVPNPFNKCYLLSKQKHGHLLEIKNYNKDLLYLQPPKLIKPFEPYHIDNCKRFIYISSYYLPINPINNEILLSENIYEKYKKKLKEFNIEKIKNNNYILYLNNKDTSTLPDEITSLPYWFNVNIYYDIASNLDYIVLKFGDLNKDNIPIVRIHSESIFNRFPIIDKKYKQIYEKSIQMILRHGCGMIVLFYNDGRGSGFGNYILQKSINNKSIVGIKNENRDYDAVSKLLFNILVNKKIILIYTCKYSREISRKEIEMNNIEICKYIYMDQNKHSKGYTSIMNKIDNCFDILNLYNKIKVINFNKNLTDQNKLIITGIGSSEANSKYFIELFKNKLDISFYPILELREININNKIIIFSQGLSNNVWKLIEKYDYKNIILFTSCTVANKNKMKVKILNQLIANKCMIVQYPIEDEYETLIRIIGPICGYLASLYLYNKIYKKKYKVSNYINFNKNIIYTPNELFINQLITHKKLTLLFPNPIYNYSQNIRNKFLEGIFINPIVSNYINFIHGSYQYLEYLDKELNKNSCIIIFKYNNNDNFYIDKIFKLLGNSYKIWILDSKFENNLKIIEYETAINYLILQIMQRLDIDQKQWHGKDNQHILYNI